MPKSSFTLDFVCVSLARPGTSSMCVALTSLFVEFSDSLHAKLMSRFQLIPLTLEETCLRETGSMLPCGSRPRKNAGSDLPECAPDSPRASCVSDSYKGSRPMGNLAAAWVSSSIAGKATFAQKGMSGMVQHK